MTFRIICRVERLAGALILALQHLTMRQSPISLKARSSALAAQALRLNQPRQLILKNLRQIMLKMISTEPAGLSQMDFGGEPNNRPIPPLSLDCVNDTCDR